MHYACDTSEPQLVHSFCLRAKLSCFTSLTGFHVVTSFLGRRTVLDNRDPKLQSMFIKPVRDSTDKLEVGGWTCKIDKDITGPFDYGGGVDTSAVDLEFSWLVPAANRQLRCNIDRPAKLTESFDLEYVSTLFVSSMATCGGVSCTNATHWKTIFARFPNVRELTVEDQAADGQCIVVEALTAKVSSGDSCLSEGQTTTWAVFPKLTTLKFRNVNCRDWLEEEQEHFHDVLDACLQERHPTLET